MFNTATGHVSSVDHWETVVYSNQTWSYYVGTSEPSLHWRELSFDDSFWLRGIGGIGYGDGDDSTTAYNPTPDCFVMYNDLSSNLPIMVINTNGQEIPDEPRIVAEMGIIYVAKGGGIL